MDVLDGAGSLRDVLVARWEHESDFSPRFIGYVAGADPRPVRYQIEFPDHLGAARIFTFFPRDDGSLDLGPILPYAAPELRLTDGDLGFLTFAGRTLQGAGSLAAGDVEAMMRLWPLGRTLGASVVTHGALRDDGVLAGTRVMGVQVEGRLSLPQPSSSPIANLPLPRILGRSEPTEDTGFRRSYWFGDGAAYPRLIEEALEKPDGGFHLRQWVLVEQRRGTGDIVPPREGARGILSVRGPLATHWSKTYPPETFWPMHTSTSAQVHEKIRSDSWHMSYREWMSDHPDAEVMVLGMTLYRRPDAIQDAWRLGLAAPAGRTSIFYTAGGAPAGEQAPQLHGAYNMASPRFDPMRLPIPIFGFGNALSFVDNYHFSVPTPADELWDFKWGMGLVGVGPSSSATPSAASTVVANDLRFLHFITVVPVATGVSGHQTWTDPLPSHVLTFNSTDGRLVWVYERSSLALPAPVQELGRDVPPSMLLSYLRSKTSPTAPMPLPDLGYFASAAAAPLFILVLLWGAWWLVKAVAPRLAVLIGYARLQGEGVLSNSLRSRLLQLISKNPAITRSELHTAAGAGWSTVVYHLGILERHKLVVSYAKGRHRHFFARGHVGRGDWDTAAVLRNTLARSLLALLGKAPGLGRRELARRLGVTAPGVAWHLRRLLAVGL
ncbi:MAG TPA: winged helix-turn-helix transcriptional regulator, partial [Candidatus Thermoplasmatota archaeon]|nr:winged helix-turn-helix transcriptional regulator [Candidatus Thermoplasmatota archaeon]